MTGTAHAAAEGLRERKKRQTRQHISDVATRLFMERGFVTVTIAEIAEHADVSVNTVYNYFPAKEDLFLDRQDAMVHRLSQAIEAREPGESAARAVFRDLRTRIETGTYEGLRRGFERFMAVINDSPALLARIMEMHELTCQAAAATLRRETGADPDDPLPLLVASQLAWVSSTVFNSVLRQLATGADPDTVERDVLVRLDILETLLGDRTMRYAVKNTP
jgi:AcrR family transcriptional regulator